MKNVLTLLILLVALVSCEKPITSADDTDTNKEVNEDDNLVIRVPADGLSAFSRLNVAIYDMDGTRIKQANQQLDLSRTASFQLAPHRRSAALSCAASFQLASGTYLLVVVAHSSNGNPTMTNPHKIQFTNAQGFTDTFLYSENITIDDQRKELYVTPKRIVSLCRFVITDDYPTDVAKMRFYYTGGSGAFDATTGLGCVNSRQSLMFDITDGQKQFDLYTFLHATEGTIHLTVSALDVSDVEISRREFDVPMKQNRITSMTGSYFTGSVSISSLTIDTDWDSEYRLSF